MLSAPSWAGPAQARWQRDGWQRWPKHHKIPAGDPERKHSYGLCACSCVSPFMHVEAARGQLCAVLCAAPAAELSQPQNWGGNSHYALRGQTRKHTFNRALETFNSAREVEEADANCLPIPSGFSNSLLPMSFPRAHP